MRGLSLGRRENGSITVFLTLAGMLIFALLGTLVETARFGACANHAARTLRTATEGLLTEYSRPLYDHYGLFFIEQEGTPYETVIARYAGDMMENSGIGKMNLLKGIFEEIRITEKQCVGDNSAEGLSKEITAYMERKLTKEQLRKFMKQTEDMQKNEEKALEIEETAEEQKALADLDAILLELMKLIDGISVSGGRIRCQQYFAKSFSTSKTLKGKDFGVTEAEVFKKMKPKIDTTPAQWKKMNQTVFVSKVKRVCEVTEKAIRKGEALQRRYQGITNKTGKEGERKEHDAMILNMVNGLPALRGNLRVLKETQALLASDQTDETWDMLDKLWKDYDTESIVFDYTGIQLSGGGANPLDALSDAWGNGILNLVCEKPDTISRQSVTNPDHYADYYEMTLEKGEDYGKRVREFTDDEQIKLSGAAAEKTSSAWDEFCLLSYIADTFGSYLEKKKDWKHRMDYGCEYVVAGKKSDRANLEAVLNRILIIRTVVNFAAIYRDSAKKSEAYAAAAAIVGFTGMEPLIRLTQTLIVVAWSMVESLVDIAGLLQKRDVPFFKTPVQILTTFTEIFQISGSVITKRAKKFVKESTKSFGYREYLKFFLLATKSDVKRYRIMDLIQWDMRGNGFGAFNLGRCVFSLSVRGSAVFPSRLFRLAPVERILGRNMQQYRSVCVINSSYL